MALAVLQACQTTPELSADETKNVAYSEVVSQRYKIAASNIAYAAIAAYSYQHR